MSHRIRSYGRASLLLWPCLMLVPFGVHADTAGEIVAVYDRERGELSPDTQAPEPQRMVNAIRSGSPSSLTALLEYGERVECLECIPLLEQKLLGSDNPKVREMAAWWLRKRAFGYGRAAVAMRSTILEDADPLRRSRAAEALGEFLDVKGLPALREAARNDAAVEVRVAAVRALGRLNARDGRAVLASALGDTDAAVRRAAIDQIQRVNHWSDHDALTARLGDSDAAVRVRAAQLLGQLRVHAAVPALIAALSTRGSGAPRQAAAWALGRIGGEEAKQALSGARDAESDPGVQDAIAVALKM
jgi:HEAT repeat protein